MIKILLVDDQDIVRRALRRWLELQDDIVVIGEATNSAEAIEAVLTLEPDVVLMDVVLPDNDGISTLATLRSKAIVIPVIVLSIHDDAATRARAQGAGANAFVKKERIEELLAAVRLVVPATGGSSAPTARNHHC